MKFKVGDRVKYVSGRWGVSSINPLWDSIERVKGTVIQVYKIGQTDGNGPWVQVDWDNGTRNSYRNTDLELLDDFTNELDGLFDI